MPNAGEERWKNDMRISTRVIKPLCWKRHSLINWITTTHSWIINIFSCTSVVFFFRSFNFFLFRVVVILFRFFWIVGFTNQFEFFFSSFVYAMVTILQQCDVFVLDWLFFCSTFFSFNEMRLSQSQSSWIFYNSHKISNKHYKLQKNTSQ